MTPEQREDAMNRREKAQERLSEAATELAAVECDVADARHALEEIEAEFPECRLWPTPCRGIFTE